MSLAVDFGHPPALHYTAKLQEERVHPAGLMARLQSPAGLHNFWETCAPTPAGLHNNLLHGSLLFATQQRGGEKVNVQRSIRIATRKPLLM